MGGQVGSCLGPLACTSGFWNCDICKASDRFQSNNCGVKWSNFVLRIWCAYRSLGPQLPFGCLLVVFLFVVLSTGFLSLRHVGTLCHADGAQGKVLSKIMPRQLPTWPPTCPSRNKVDFWQNKPYFWQKWALFLDGQCWQSNSYRGLSWKGKRALGWSCFCATSKGIVENNIPAYHFCLASCLIHRFGGCCPPWRCNQAAMICINISL